MWGYKKIQEISLFHKRVRLIPLFFAYAWLVIYHACNISSANFIYSIEYHRNHTSDYSIHFSILAVPAVAFTTAGTPIAGSKFALICTVTVEEGLVSEGRISVIRREDGIAVSTVMSGRVSTLRLEFYPLLTSQGGHYFCRTTVDTESPGIVDFRNSSNHTVIVQSNSCYVDIGRSYCHKCINLWQYKCLINP